MLKFFLKTIIYVILSSSVCFLFQFVSPIVGNYLAVQQMSNMADSSFQIQMYSIIQNNFYVIWIGITLLVYLDDIIKIYLKIKGE